MSKLKLQKEREKLTVWEEIFCWLIVIIYCFCLLMAGKGLHEFIRDLK